MNNNKKKQSSLKISMVDNQVSDEFDHEMNHQISMEDHTNDQYVLIKMKKIK